MTLQEYIEQTILPQYDAFDGGHKRDHAEAVIAESLRLARAHNADEQMAYVIAAYHDLGLRFDREKHHIHSGEILMADENLRKWFTQEQLLTMRDAVEDHRASGKNPPRTIYGAIVAKPTARSSPKRSLHEPWRIPPNSTRMATSRRSTPVPVSTCWRNTPKAVICAYGSTPNAMFVPSKPSAPSSATNPYSAPSANNGTKPTRVTKRAHLTKGLKLQE